MRLAILVQCHKNAFMVNALLDKLIHEQVDVFVHVDAKSNILKDIVPRRNVWLLHDDERVNVRWGDISQVHASISLLNKACLTDHYDYLWLMSGQDMLLKPIDQIVEYLKTCTATDFIGIIPSQCSSDARTHFDKRCEVVFPRWLIGLSPWQRVATHLWVLSTGGWNKTFPMLLRAEHNSLGPFYFGSQWWCLRGEVVQWMLEYMESHPAYLQYFSRVFCPDESFFQTLYMRSPYAHNRSAPLLYEVWDDEPHPKTLQLTDVLAALASGKLVARKWEFSGPSDEAYQLLCKSLSVDEIQHKTGVS